MAVRNSIVANNTGGNCNVAMTSQGYNVSNDASCGFTDEDTDKQNVDPKLGLLTDNGGTTQTLALAADSPARGMIPTANCKDAANASLTTDQRGAERPFPVGGPCDSGAFEYVPPIFIAANGADANDCLSDATACLTLGGAVAKAHGGALVQVPAGTYNERITLGKNIRMVGAGPKTTILDGQAGGPVLTVNSGVTASVSDVTIRNGAGTNGGGVVNSGTLSVKNSAVRGNTAGGGGGGVFNAAGAALLLVNSLVTGNTAPAGGGLDNSGQLGMVNVTVSGNSTVSSAPGAALRTTAEGYTSLLHSTIAANGTIAGGIANWGTTVARASIISDNGGVNCTAPLITYGSNRANDVSCAFTDASDAQSLDVGLLPLGDYGGPTETIAQRFGSVALDAVAFLICQSGPFGPLPDDQRGVSRGVPAGAACDSGAYEADRFSLVLKGLAPALPVINAPFSITVEVRSPQAGLKTAAAATPVTLALKRGTGVLGGTLTKTLPVGQSSLTFTDLTYNTAATDVILSASVGDSGDRLLPGASSPIRVNSGRTWFVNATTGNNGNTCDTTAKACKTVNAAAAKAVANDIIEIGVGVFNERVAIAKPLTLRGAGSTGTVLDGGGFGTVITVNNGVTALMENLVIRNGSAVNGGGVLNNGGTLTLRSITVTTNNATTGGGIYNNGGILTIERSTISLNNAAGNLADGTGSGGGIANAAGTVQATDVTIFSNSARTAGGGVLNMAGAVMNINGASLLVNNSQVKAGGVANFGALTLLNSTFNQNSAATAGALLNADGGTTQLMSSTLTRNKSGNATSGAVSNTSGQTLTLRNSILLQNTTLDCDGVLTDGGYNLLGSEACGLTVGGSNGNLAAPVSFTFTTPSGLSNPPPYLLLPEGSPAKDAIPTANCTDAVGQPLLREQRGGQRGVQATGVNCDIGATESGPMLVWNAAKGPRGSFPGVAAAVSFGAVDDLGKPYKVGAHTPFTVSYTASDGTRKSVTGVILAGASDGLAVIGGDLTVSGQTELTLTADNGSLLPGAYSYTSFVIPSISTSMHLNSDFTTTYGSLSEQDKARWTTNFTADIGGAAGIAAKRVNVTNVVSGRLVDEGDNDGSFRPAGVGADNFGGVMQIGDAPGEVNERMLHVLPGGSLTLDNFLVRYGQSADGGGVILNEGTVILKNSTVTQGAATGSGKGGAILNRGTLILENTIITGNTAGGDGGGIYNEGTLFMTNSVVQSNTAGGSGAAIFNAAGASMEATGSVFTANTATGTGGALTNGGTLSLISSTLSANQGASGAG
ncbi:MAG: hypothetical protein NTZ05_04770, partial [Chloroflexi bacterium]|nr:hypothetical protein [Chloroflexota bacterium]